MLNYRQKLKEKEIGFTVAELMIAMAVFSVLLLISLAGFLQIGQQFFKGVNITRTANMARQINTSIKNDITFDTNMTAITRQTAPISVGGEVIDRHWFCAGPNRYSFILGRQLNTDDQDNRSNPSSGWYKFRLLKDRLGLPTAGCPNPFDSVSGVLIDPDSVTELLGDKMRLSNLTLTRLRPADSELNRLYTLVVRIAYGDDEVMTNPPESENATCLAHRSASTYCFVTSVRTTARQGIRP
jgi:prepilin-type N-terminal cleavage/methylation domain-containing protein